ncbi:MAG: branched-chain amino acid transport system II carrier protein [Erysipelotrichales bacterium]
MNKNLKDMFVVGFALFAMFFGAGNLIFPPYLGVISGQAWLAGFLGFLFADVGLAILSLLASAKKDGDIEKIFIRAGKKFSVVLASLIMICLGPLLAIPRTGATTFEMGIEPIFPNFNMMIFLVIFFGLTLFLTIRPSKVVDIIGAYLTPILLIVLIFMIAKGVLFPLGGVDTKMLIDSAVTEGIQQGYQTMDALAGVALSTVVITSLMQKGYKNLDVKIKMTLKSGLVAAIGLLIVYGGLTYLGATYANELLAQNPGLVPEDIDRTKLIVAITEELLGGGGKIALAIIVALACLTTSIGLVSACAGYFAQLSKNKLPYEKLVIAICAFSIVIAQFGVDTIISFAAPILSIIYPATVILVICTLFEKYIKNDNSVRLAAYIAILYSLIEVFGGIANVDVSFLKVLPLASFGFGWVIPAIVAGIVGAFIPSKSTKRVTS